MSKWHTTEFCKDCAKEFCCTNECKYHLLHRIKKAKEEIKNISIEVYTDYEKYEMVETKDVLAILDKITESGGANEK